MANLLLEKRQEVEAKQKAVQDIWDEAGEDMDLAKVKSIQGDTAAKLSEIKRLNKDLDAAGTELVQLQELEKSLLESKGWAEYLNDPKSMPGMHGDGDGSRPETKTIGARFVASEAFKEWKSGDSDTMSVSDLELKALFRTSAGWDPQDIRESRVVMSAQRPVQVLDFIPQTPTNQSAVVYMEETTFTNAAVETAEFEGVSDASTAAQGVYQESALALTERSSAVRKIATFVPVTDEQLEDVEGIEGYINQRLVFMLRQRLDAQIINGSGSGNLLGVAQIAGRGTIVKNPSEPSPSTIYRCMTNVRVVGRSAPNLCIMHPMDWQNIRLLQTADGMYIYGSPSEAVEPRIWGLPVVEADSLPEGTAVVGDFINYTAVRDKRDVDIQISNSHGELFVRGAQAIRADIRAAFVIYRPAAICTGTGL